MAIRRYGLLPAVALLLALAAGCRAGFAEQVRGAGLRYDAPPPAAGDEAAGPPAAAVRPRRTFGGYLAQALLPGALLLDAAVWMLDVVGLAVTVAGWEKVVP